MSAMSFVGRSLSDRASNDASIFTFLSIQSSCGCQSIHVPVLSRGLVLRIHELAEGGLLGPINLQSS